MKRISGTEGYADEAPELFRHYESISAAEVHDAILHLHPKLLCKIVDIGAGTGRDAAWFAGMGHQVVAVEPLDATRIPAMALHTSPISNGRTTACPISLSCAGAASGSIC